MKRLDCAAGSLCIDFRMHSASGIGRYITNLAPLLKGYFQIILIGPKEEITSKYAWALDLNIIDCNAKIYGAKEQIKLFLKIPKCDFFWSPHYNIPILPIKAKKRIVTIHDVYHLAFFDKLSLMQKLYARIMINMALKLSDIIFTDSSFSKSEIIKYTQTKKSIDVVYCAVKPLALTFKSVYDFKYILYVGNIKPHKNLKASILAYMALPSELKDIKFVIVGKKDDFITADVEALKMSDENIIFTGHISDETLNSLYKNAKALLFASLYEGFGLPPLEAQLCDCPVVASNIASLPEVCGDGAIYCNPYDADDICAKLTVALTNETLRQDLIAKGFKNVKRFNWAKSAKIIASILQKK